MRERIWAIEVAFTEDESTTRADAILELGDRHLHGWGRAKRNPVDPDVPVVGEELAAARALSDLAHQLLHEAATRIERYEGRAVSVHL